MRDAVVALVACATCASCGPNARARPVGVSGAGSDEARTDAGIARDGGAELDTLPTLADLAARAPLVAPGMREAAKAEQAGDRARTDVVRAVTRDLCARVAFVASAPVTARLEDGAGNVLARVAAAQAGALGERGPVCVRRGDVIRVSFDASLETRARVRWVGWAAP